MPRTFPCPRCGEASLWENNEFRPFCSERCKMIDLGAWATESYRVPVAESDESEELPTADPDFRPN